MRKMQTSRKRITRERLFSYRILILHSTKVMKLIVKAMSKGPGVIALCKIVHCI